MVLGSPPCTHLHTPVTPTHLQHRLLLPPPGFRALRPQTLRGLGQYCSAWDSPPCAWTRVLSAADLRDTPVALARFSGLGSQKPQNAPSPCALPPHCHPTAMPRAGFHSAPPDARRALPASCPPDPDPAASRRNSSAASGAGAGQRGTKLAQRGG